MLKPRRTRPTVLRGDRQVTSGFGNQRRSQTTADEHKAYVRMFDGWLVRQGFGSYFEVDVAEGWRVHRVPVDCGRL